MSVRPRAAIRVLDLKSDPECYKEFKIGAVRHPRYSQTAITRIKSPLAERTEDEIWLEYRRLRSSRA